LNFYLSDVSEKKTAARQSNQSGRQARVASGSERTSELGGVKEAKRIEAQVRQSKTTRIEKKKDHWSES
jgi:hypothetical protein